MLAYNFPFYYVLMPMILVLMAIIKIITIKSWSMYVNGHEAYINMYWN